MTRVLFTDVGRDKRTWNLLCEKVTGTVLWESIKRRGGLMSRDVEFDMDPEGNGMIFAGMNCVGRFKVFEDAP